MIAVALLFAFAFVAQAQAQPYPYTLIDPGTFGGPGSFVVVPFPITPNGTVLAAADTATPDTDLPASPDCFCDGYVQHAAAFRAGHLVDLGALAPAAENNSGSTSSTATGSARASRRTG